MKPILSSLVGGVASLLIAVPIGAQEISRERLVELLQPTILSVQHLALNPTVSRAVNHLDMQAFSQAEVERRDAEWRDEAAGSALRHTVSNNDVARLLARHVNYNESFSQAFLTDTHGSTVAAFPVTPEYWHGDGAHFADAFDSGSGQVVVGPLELNPGTNTYQAQVSVPVVRSDSTIGVLVVGVTLDAIRAMNAN